MSSSLDTRLETWDDPTPRESEFSLKDLRGAFIAAARQHSSVNTMPLTREERLKRRDKNDRNSLMIALEVYTKKHNLQVTPTSINHGCYFVLFIAMLIGCYNSAYYLSEQTGVSIFFYKFYRTSRSLTCTKLELQLFWY
jgi:hypothetical protein